MCNCKKNKHTEAAAPVDAEAKAALPERSGTCPYCLRKHLLKARGYAREVDEGASGREWEVDNLIENLALAEDHALALADASLRASLRNIRHAAESGGSVADRIAELYERFAAQYFRATPPAIETPATDQTP